MTVLGSLRLDEFQVFRLSDRAQFAHCRACFHCAKHLTDGFIGDQELAMLRVRAPERRELTEGGVWDEREGGVEIRDYLRDNPSRAEVEARRGKAAQRMRTVRKHVRANKVPESAPVRTHVPENNVTNGTGVSPLALPSSLPLDLKSSPNPESSYVLASDPKDLTGGARPRRSKRKASVETEFPDDFSVTETEIKLAAELGLTEYRERAAFKDKALAHGWTAKDWRARYRTWLRKAQEFASSSKPPGAVQHEKTRVEEARRPYHEAFKLERPEPKASPAEALEAISAASKAIGRRIPA